MNASPLLQKIEDQLPSDFHILRSEAAAEGYRFLDRMMDEWNEGTARFNKPSEALLIARCDGIIAGVGGMTVDPFDDLALRMRRFYVRARFRRNGVAGKMARSLLEQARETKRCITVNAGTDTAPTFWETMGFSQTDSEHHTHVLDPALYGSLA